MERQDIHLFLAPYGTLGGMPKSIGVAAEDELMLTLVMRAAERFDAEVIAFPVRMNHDWASDWGRCDAFIYDEDQVGGDTIEALEYVEWSMFVDRAEVSNWESNGIIGRIERFLGEALSDHGSA